MISYQHLRHKYKPDKIRVLFVGESPPAGGTFFYKADSKLYHFTQRAFSDVFGVAFEDKRFLDWFKNICCYLADLCPTPINKKNKRERRGQWVAGVESLSKCIRAASPQAIVIVMRAIAPYVNKAASKAGVDPTRIYSLPFPSHGHQQRYFVELIQVLNKLREDNILCTGVGKKIPPMLSLSF
jgi:hypothetical protein